MTEPCPHCGIPSLFLYDAKDVNHRIGDGPYRYYLCTGCGLLFLSPPPEQPERFYPPGYYTIPGSLAELARAAEPERYKIDLVTRFVRGGRLLEIGPAWGNFLYLAREARFDVEAIEMDGPCCDFLERTLGVRTVRSSNVPEALKEVPPCNAVVLWHVIEHLPDPWRALEAIAAKILPGGILVIAAPNPSAWQFKVQGKYWPHLDAPRHLFLIPPALLSRKAVAIGLTSLFTTTRDAGSLGWNVFGWQVFLANFSRNRYLKAALRLLGRALAAVAAPLDGREGRGSAYTIVFRKNGETP